MRLEACFTQIRAEHGGGGGSLGQESLPESRMCFWKRRKA